MPSISKHQTNEKVIQAKEVSHQPAGPHNIMKQLLHDVGVIARTNGESFYLAQCELQSSTNKARPVLFKYTVYVHNNTHHSGSTPEEALEKLRKSYGMSRAPKAIQPADILV